MQRWWENRIINRLKGVSEGGVCVCVCVCRVNWDLNQEILIWQKVKRRTLMCEVSKDDWGVKDSVMMEIEVGKCPSLRAENEPASQRSDHGPRTTCQNKGRI